MFKAVLRSAAEEVGSIRSSNSAAMRPQEQPGDDGTPRYHAGMESIATRRSRVDEREGSTDGESVPCCHVLMNSLSNGAGCKASATDYRHCRGR